MQLPRFTIKTPNQKLFKQAVQLGVDALPEIARKLYEINAGTVGNSAIAVEGLGPEWQIAQQKIARDILEEKGRGVSHAVKNITPAFMDIEFNDVVSWWVHLWLKIDARSDLCSDERIEFAVLTKILDSSSALGSAELVARAIKKYSEVYPEKKLLEPENRALLNSMIKVTGLKKDCRD